MRSLSEILDRARIKWFIEDIWHMRHNEVVDKYADLLSHYRYFSPIHLN